MPLERLSPQVKKYDLGCLRLWQDELAEIVRLLWQLPNVDVRIESDDNRLTDVRADLPQLGQRVSYFSVTATRPADKSDAPPQDVISVKLAKDRCRIEATDPDLTTTGLIEGIKSLVENCRRMSPRLLPLYRPSAGGQRTGETAVPLALLAGAAGLTFGVIFGIGAVQHFVHHHGAPFVTWPTSIIVSLPALLLTAALCFGWARARTLLFTGTRAEAPTFWQRKRSDIAINVVVGVALYLLGLLTAHF